MTQPASLPTLAEVQARYTPAPRFDRPAPRLSGTESNGKSMIDCAAAVSMRGGVVCLDNGPSRSAAIYGRNGG